MGYRPVPQKKDKREVKRLKQLESFRKERDAYLTLLREYSSDGNTFMVDVTAGMIKDVDKRIKEIDPPPPLPPRISPIVASRPLPPANTNIIQEGHFA